MGIITAILQISSSGKSRVRVRLLGGLMNLLDTNIAWAKWSVSNFTLALILHVIFSGWFTGLPFSNWYNNQGVYGLILSNGMHLVGVYSIVGLLMNLNLPRKTHEHPYLGSYQGETKAFYTSNLMWIVTLLWEFAEYLYFSPTHGFVINPLDTLMDLSTGWAGAQLAVLHAERAIS